MAEHEAQPQEVIPVAGLRNAFAYWLLLCAAGVSDVNVRR
jgi:hypothetical protein